MATKTKYSIWKKKGFLWVTLAIFIISIVLHWVFGWEAYKNEQLAHNQPVQFAEYFIEMMRDTMENWQSEFLQLMWQVAGLTILWYVGSPQSKESEERTEQMMEFIIKNLDREKGEKFLKALEEKFPKK